MEVDEPVWSIENRTPFAVDRSWVRDREGAEVWLVAVRCTFDVRPDGSTAPATEQQPVVQAPKHFGQPTTSSLMYDSDFVLTKPTTDVILHGSAHAPGRKPTTSVDVALRVADVRKTLRVTGDRIYRSSALRGETVPDPALPFVTLPLTYERTWGGADPTTAHTDRPRFEERNPIGTGFVPVAGKLAPNIEYLGGASKRPAGFGPVASHWIPRATHAGTYDDAWIKNRRPLYPRDLDDRFFLCSPEDQRPATFLRGGEIVELTNLTPSGRLLFALPRVALGFETRFMNGERIQHAGTLHTVLLEPSAPRVVLVWRASLPCHAKVNSLAGTTVWQKHIRVVKAGRLPSDDVVIEEGEVQAP